MRSPAGSSRSSAALSSPISFSGLARAFPQDDGPYGYTKRAFGDGVAFIAMWCYWFSTWVTNATIAIGVVGYLTVLIPGLSPTPGCHRVTALCLLWFFVVINLRRCPRGRLGADHDDRVEAGSLLGVICLGLWVLLTHPAAYTQHIPPNPATLTR